jgi:uncharacterized membrane protein
MAIVVGYGLASQKIVIVNLLLFFSIALWLILIWNLVSVVENPEIKAAIL